MRTTGVTKEVRMPIKSLPSNPDLEHLKHQARDILNALTSGIAEAAARVREFHPRYARMSDDEIRTSKLSLAAAQLIIAREYGFPSWPRLKHHVELSAQATASIAVLLPGFKPPAGPIELKQKWPSGTRIVREIDLKQNMEIHTPGKPDPVEHKLSLMSQYAYTAVNELPGGGHEVALQHLAFRMEADLWRYDTALSSVAHDSEIAKLFKIILGAKVRYFLNANDQVERMEGVDKLLNRLNLYEGAKLKPGMTWDNQALDKVLSRILSGMRQPSANAVWGLRKMFNEDYFKNKLDPSFLPGKAVQPGDTWTFSRESRKDKRSLFSVNLLRECTVVFQSWEMRADQLCARLDFHGTQKTTPGAGTEMAKAINPVTDGTFSGALWFDPEQGRAIEINVNHDFKLTSNKVAMPAPYAKPPIQPATDYYHQIITEKLVSVKKSDGSS